MMPVLGLIQMHVPGGRQASDLTSATSPSTSV